MTERRAKERYKITSLEYLTFSDGNGGIVVDMSDDGIGVQTVAALRPGTTVDFSVLLSQLGAPIEASAEVIWVTRGGQAGLRLATMPDATRQHITKWMLAVRTKPESDSEGNYIQPRPSGIAADTQSQPQAQEATPAPTVSEHGAQNPSARGPVAVPKSPGETIPAISTAAAADPVGPFSLSDKMIEACADQKGYAVYLLGMFQSDRFLVMRLGRSSDLANDLYSYIGQYEGFKFAYCPSEKRAFQQECELYHRLRPVNNKSHPRKPSNTDWDCPVCRGFT